MKKSIALFLTLALCASCVVVLASCGEAGESAYQIAVRNGFEGDEAAWLESLKGAKGADGAEGAKGDNGKDGDDGADGANGKSAYELAVDNGFVGTEAEWVASLQGKDGVDGQIDFTQVTFGVNAEGYLTVNGFATNQKVADLKPAA